MKDPDSLAQLVLESRRLRDHLLHVEGQDSVALSNALRPFDRADDPLSLGDKEVNALSSAFQDAYDSAHGSIDAFTLTEVLKGYSPHKHRGTAKGSLLMALIGVILVGAAFHFSYWTNRTTFIVAKADAFVEFDHFNKIMRLVELQNYFELNSEPATSPDLEPQLVYLEGITALRDHYTSEQFLPKEMRDSQLQFVPFRKQWDKAKRQYCSVKLQRARAEKARLDALKAEAAEVAKGDDMVARNTGLGTAPIATQTQSAQTADSRTLRDMLFRCPEQLMPMQPLPPPLNQTVQAQAAQDAVLRDPGFFRQGVNTVAVLQRSTMSEAGRQRYNSYAASRHEVAEMMQELKQLLNIVTLWALPIIYGALGSVVYCMSRILNPDLAPLGRVYSVVRTAFAGLAALTFSMLIVPSNALSGGIDLNSPVVYLASFIFGYSIEAFVNLLNRLNTYLSSSLTPRKRKAE